MEILTIHFGEDMKMKVKRFSAKMIAFILIVVVLASIIVTNTGKQTEIKEEILCGYTEIMDARLENFLDSTKTSYFDFPPSEYGERLGLTEITYEVTNIKKKMTYMCCLWTFS